MVVSQPAQLHAARCAKCGGTWEQRSTPVSSAFRWCVQPPDRREWSRPAPKVMARAPEAVSRCPVEIARAAGIPPVPGHRPIAQVDIRMPIPAQKMAISPGNSAQPPARLAEDRPMTDETAVRSGWRRRYRVLPRVEQRTVGSRWLYRVDHYSSLPACSRRRGGRVDLRLHCGGDSRFSRRVDHRLRIGNLGRDPGDGVRHSAHPEPRAGRHATQARRVAPRPPRSPQSASSCSKRHPRKP